MVSRLAHKPTWFISIICPTVHRDCAEIPAGNEIESIWVADVPHYQVKGHGVSVVKLTHLKACPAEPSSLLLLCLRLHCRHCYYHCCCSVQLRTQPIPSSWNPARRGDVKITLTGWMYTKYSSSSSILLAISEYLWSEWFCIVNIFMCPAIFMQNPHVPYPSLSVKLPSARSLKNLSFTAIVRIE